MRDDDSVSGFTTKSSSISSHQSVVSDLAKKPSTVKSISGAIPLSKLSTQGLISLSEARVLLSRQEDVTRIVGVSLQKKKSLPIVSKVSKPASVVRKSSGVKRTGLTKYVTTRRKSSSIKNVVAELPKRKPIPKKIFEPAEAITPKKTTKLKIKTELEESKPNNRALLYLRGEFLALRTDDGEVCFYFSKINFREKTSRCSRQYIALLFADEFFLCELLQHIYASTQSFKIMWLTAENNSHEIFYEDYIDHSEVAYWQRFFSCFHMLPHTYLNFRGSSRAENLQISMLWKLVEAEICFQLSAWNL